jgi:diguanylate cyclase (GGDEF)-like protein
MLLRADRAGAVRVAQALRAAVAEISTLPGGPPGLSIGVAVLPDDADTVEALVTASDAALYEAKTSGRGRVSVAADSGLPLA